MRNLEKVEVKVPKQTTSFIGLLTILFIALKLTDVITWSWWLVLMPLWIFPAILVCLLVILCVTFLGACALDKWGKS